MTSHFMRLISIAISLFCGSFSGYAQSVMSRMGPGITGAEKADVWDLSQTEEMTPD